MWKPLKDVISNPEKKHIQVICVFNPHFPFQFEVHNFDPESQTVKSRNCKDCTLGGGSTPTYPFLLKNHGYSDEMGCLQ